jgi:ATP synthase in type III secretion protein N
MSLDDDYDRLLGSLEDLNMTVINGRITEIIGMLIKAIVPNVKIGEVCLVKRDGEPLRTEVVGFTQEEVILSPL